MSRDPLDALDPLAAQWFTARFSAVTQAQALAWPAIASGAHAMLVAPTGSGKTLAAFLQPLGRLAREAIERRKSKGAVVSEPDAGVRVLYISPLRALDADVHHNLHAPLEGISSLANAQGNPISITHAVRTGDTSQRARREAAKRPPHVLITTPESLFVLLGSEAHRRSLARVELVIVDELHAIADSKRGTHLALSLERLEALCARPVQRVGLTATAEPLERLARLLGGDRAVKILDGRRSRSIELSVELAPKIEGQRGVDPRIQRVATHVAHSVRSLVFVGSRAVAERWRPALEKALAEQTPDREEPAAVGIHHGALAKEVREVVEAGLRDGALRTVVATSSLELGIDIGAVDKVVQVGAPGGVARLLQRVGRAGHSPGQTSKGVIVSSGGVDLIECAITARLAIEAKLEPIRVPEGPIDVLAQQLVAHAASEPDGTTIDGFLSLARRCDPYRALTRESLVRVVDVLASELHRAPRLEWDRHTGRLTAPDLAKRLARTAGGTITTRGLYRMLDADSRETIGELDEEFVHESKPGDRFSFGLGVFRIVSIRPDAVLVRKAPPGTARMPFWRGDRPMRAEATGRAMGAVVRSLEAAVERGPEDCAEMLAKLLPLSRTAAVGAADELCTQAKATPLPTDRRLVVEVYADALGEPRIAIHAWHGRSVLEPWALALASRIEARLGGVVHAVATDNGVLIAPPKGPSVDAASVAKMVTRQEVRALVASILPRTAIAGAAFREAAERSLLLPKQPFKKRTPLWMNRQRARDLLLTVGDDPTHPLIVEASREVMDDRWNVAALERLLSELEDGTVAIETVTRRTPSLFARGLERAFEADNLYEDDTPAAETAARRASATGGDDGGGSFESPLEFVGLAEPADRGVLTGLSHEAPLALQLFRAGGPVRISELARHLRVDEEGVRALLAPLLAAGQAVVGRFSEREPGDMELEVCDAEALARMRRKALSKARRQIEPVSRRAFQRWLIERHRVGPMALDGQEAIDAAVERLALFPMPPEVFERDLLRARVGRYEPAWLDLLFARGEARYVLLESPARIVLAPSSSTEPFPPPSGRLDGSVAESVRAVLRERGALFLADVVLSVKKPVADVTEVLGKMLSLGELTNDSFAPARALALGVVAKSSGRWALRASLGGDVPVSALVDRVLARYGVVAREFVEREELSPAWTMMREELDRRESRGEVRRGEIVAGLGPVQFARTDTIESLRAARSDVSHDPVLLSSRDPALAAECGGLSRSSSVRVVVRDGEAVCVVERDGAALRTLRDLSERDAFSIGEALRSLARLPANLRPFRTLAIERLDDGPASRPGVLRDVLSSLGFESDGPRLSLASFRA
jgi:ATP-dependent Lhr-like helicase